MTVNPDCEVSRLIFFGWTHWVLVIRGPTRWMSLINGDILDYVSSHSSPPYAKLKARVFLHFHSWQFPWRRRGRCIWLVGAVVKGKMAGQSWKQPWNLSSSGEVDFLNPTKHLREKRNLFFIIGWTTNWKMAASHGGGTNYSVLFMISHNLWEPAGSFLLFDTSFMHVYKLARGPQAS